MAIRERDFHLTIDHAAGLLVDAMASTRASVRVGGVPAAQSRSVARALKAMHSAQDNLFIARNEPWERQRPLAKHRQLALL